MLLYYLIKHIVILLSIFIVMALIFPAKYLGIIYVGLCVVYTPCVGAYLIIKGKDEDI